MPPRKKPTAPAADEDPVVAPPAPKRRGKKADDGEVVQLDPVVAPAPAKRGKKAPEVSAPRTTKKQGKKADVVVEDAPAAPSPSSNSTVVTSPSTTSSPSSSSSSSSSSGQRRTIDPKRLPSKDLPKWELLYNDALIVRRAHEVPAMVDGKLVAPKIAAFDMDDTLVTRKSGADFPQDENDWKWLYDSIPIRLKQLYEEGWEIVIFTNQNGVGVGKKRDSKLASQLQTKIDTLMDTLHIPITTYMACDKDRFRKPSRGMFDLMLDHYYEKLKALSPTQVDQLSSLIDPHSFYTGDACGRGGLTKTELKKRAGVLKDHSAGDYLFSVNAWGYKVPTNPADMIAFPGQNFYTPESLFEQKQSHAPFNPSNGSTNAYQFPINDYSFVETELYKYLLKNKAQSQLILMVALPASGKTTFCQQLMHTISTDPAFAGAAATHWVNRDVLKTPEKCVKETMKGLEEKKIVIVDNTNVDEKTREEYIALAKKYNVPFHAVVFKSDKVLAAHLNLVRTGLSLGERERLPGVAINMANSKFVEPTAKEGYTTLTIHQHVHPSTQWTSSNPYQSAPWTLTPKKTAAAGTHIYVPEAQFRNQYGPVTQSRVLEDYYYQHYEH